MTTPGEAAPDRTFEDLLRRYMDQYPAKILVELAGRGLTASDLDAAAEATANALAAMGIGPGDVVGLFAATCPEWLEVFFAAPRIGAVSAPLNLALRGPQLAYQLELARIRVVFVDSPHLERVLEAAKDVESLTAVVVIGAEIAHREVGAIQIWSLPRLLEESGAVAHSVAALSPEAPATIIFTSGTTGRSKGVVLSQRYQTHVAGVVAGICGYDDQDIAYGAVPLFHMSGLGTTFAALSVGARAVLDEQFSVSRFWDRIAEVGATGFHGVGPMLTMLWSQPRSPSDPQNSLRVAMVAPIPPGLHLQYEQRWGFKLTPVYGLTEAVPIAYQRWDEAGVPGSVGRPSPSLDVRVVDDVDDDVAIGEVGEIVCRPVVPYTMFLGYFENPEATLEQSGNLWFHSGDLGRFDADGNLYFIDRKKDAIRRRGENISSAEVEIAVLGHPAVAECAAFPVPSEVGEDEVRIAVVVEPGKDLSERQLIAYCAEQLPYFAVPRYIDFVVEIPKNAVGRVLKYVLREQAATRAAWDRETSGIVLDR